MGLVGGGQSTDAGSQCSSNAGLRRQRPHVSTLVQSSSTPHPEFTGVNREGVGTLLLKYSTATRSCRPSVSFRCCAEHLSRADRGARRHARSRAASARTRDVREDGGLPASVCVAEVDTADGEGGREGSEGRQRWRWSSPAVPPELRNTRDLRAAHGHSDPWMRDGRSRNRCFAKAPRRTYDQDKAIIHIRKRNSSVQSLLSDT